jgi:hypothetical protein
MAEDLITSLSQIRWRTSWRTPMLAPFSAEPKAAGLPTERLRGCTA